MSAARSYIDDQTLKTLQLEIVALKAVIESDQASKLKELHTLHTSNTDAVTLQRIKFHKQNIELEYHARLKFLLECHSTSDFIISTKKRRLNSPLFRQFQLKEDFLAYDMDLLITTIRLTNQLISKPDESANTLTLLAKHAETINSQMQHEQQATKKKSIWLGIASSLIALLSLACAVSILVFMPVLGFGATLALSALAFLFLVGGNTLFPIAFGLSNSPCKPAENVSALCNTAESLHIPKMGK